MNFYQRRVKSMLNNYAKNMEFTPNTPQSFYHLRKLARRIISRNLKGIRVVSQKSMEAFRNGGHWK